MQLCRTGPNHSLDRPPDKQLMAGTGRKVNASQSSTFSLQQLLGLLDALPNQQEIEKLALTPQHALNELMTMRCFYETGIHLNQKDDQLAIQVEADHQLDQKTQRISLRLLLENRGIVHLSLLNFSELNDHLLNQLILNNSSTLKILDLRRCRQVSWAPIIANHPNLFHLEELIFSDCQLIEGNFCLIFGRPVPLPNLKKLVFNPGSTLRPCQVALDAPLLQYLKLRGNFYLTSSIITQMVNNPLKGIDPGNLDEVNWDPDQSSNLVDALLKAKTVTTGKGLLMGLLSDIKKGEHTSKEIVVDVNLTDFEKDKKHYTLQCRDGVFSVLINLLKRYNGWIDLSFYPVKLKPDQVRMIFQVLPKSLITRLYLFECKISKAGAQALAQGLPGSQVIQLDLRYNQIGKAGARVLAQALPQSKITKLNLQGTQIGKSGAQALPQSQITELDLTANGIGYAGAQALAQALPQSQVTVIRAGSA